MKLLPRLDQAATGRARTLLKFGYGIAGIALAAGVAWQWPPTRHLATAIWASGAVIAVVLGLAAQGTLANPIAGLVLAFAQPFRIGDHITMGDISGTVVRIGVAYTRLSLTDGGYAEVPNSVLGASTINVSRRPSASPG